MAGIYFHIPFCKQACNYCNFHFSVNTAKSAAMIDVMAKELVKRHNELGGQKVKSIYFGGGTPSILPVKDIKRLLDITYSKFELEEHIECTLEANPDDINEINLSAWKEAGINRLSIGVQSFIDSDLRWMNRSHTAKQALDCIIKARKAGFESFTIDLIYGTPGLSNEAWEKNLQLAISMNIEHLSCYALTVEDKTALDLQIKRGQSIAPIEETIRNQFIITKNILETNGYRHYEISNYAKPGKEAMHNSGYWNGMHYIGIGPSAHSYNGKERRWNIANNSLYLTNMGATNAYFEMETLSKQNIINEYLMTNLRLSKGIEFDEMNRLFGENITAEIKTTVKDIYYINYIELTEKNMKLTLEGQLMSDSVISSLFYTD